VGTGALARSSGAQLDYQSAKRTKQVNHGRSPGLRSKKDAKAPKPLISCEVTESKPNRVLLEVGKALSNAILFIDRGDDDFFVLTTIFVSGDASYHQCECAGKHSWRIDGSREAL
jgi:hypothetical protein